VLPRATHYVVHPLLSEVIGQINPAYLARIDRTNIVGYGRSWQEAASAEPGATARMSCVLAADIQEFGGLMRAGVDAPVRRALEEAVRMSAKNAVCAETGAGDAGRVIHDDPVALARSARHLVGEVYSAPGQPRLRVALHHGEVLTRRERDGSTAVAGGEGVLCAVRVEPHVEPGQIWAAEEFRGQLGRQPSLWRTSPVVLPGAEERFNAREGDEPDLWMRLYRLELRAPAAASALPIATTHILRSTAASCQSASEPAAFKCAAGFTLREGHASCKSSSGWARHRDPNGLRSTRPRCSWSASFFAGSFVTVSTASSWPSTRSRRSSSSRPRAAFGAPC
jgi:class 3 adenylate cyclase